MSNPPLNRGQTHILKTDEPYFQAIIDGRKNFEVRVNDRGFQTGDHLHLIEVRPAERGGKEATGRTMTVEVTYVLQGGRFGIEAGWCVMGIRE